MMIPPPIATEAIEFEGMPHDDEVVRFAMECADKLEGTTDMGEGSWRLRVARVGRSIRVRVVYDAVILAEAIETDAVMAVRAAFAQLFSQRVSRVSTPPPMIHWTGAKDDDE